jgi:hypothetical protein
MNKIASKLNKRLQKDGTKKIIELDAVKASRIAAEEALESVKSLDSLADEGYHPVFSAYANAQQLLSVMLEGLLMYPELERFSRAIEGAEELYMPGGPPMSPITDSLFYTWSISDLSIGLQKESLLSIVCDLSGKFKLPQTLVKIYQHFKHSYMGVYLHEGIEQSNIVLREIHTGHRYQVFNQSGYEGHKGELWYARLLPNFMAGNGQAICFTTPYIIMEVLSEWEAFIRREIWAKHKKSLTYSTFIQRGLSSTYWLEYVTQAYSDVNQDSTAIFLKGTPDQSHTRPHADIDASGRRLPDHTAIVKPI